MYQSHREVTICVCVCMCVCVCICVCVGVYVALAYVNVCINRDVNVCVCVCVYVCMCVCVCVYVACPYINVCINLYVNVYVCVCVHLRICRPCMCERIHMSLLHIHVQICGNVTHLQIKSYIYRYDKNESYILDLITYSLSCLLEFVILNLHI